MLYKAHHRFTTLVNFINGLLLNHFEKCTLTIVVTQQDSNFSITRVDNGVYFNEIGSAINTPKISLSLAYHRLDFNKSAVPPIRYAPVCKVVLFAFEKEEETASAVSTGFLDLLTSTANELTRRDQDFYILLSNSEQESRTLLRTKISTELRYKISICLKTSNVEGETTNNSILAFAVCVYCPDKRILEVSTNALDSLPKIFPDHTKDFHQYPVRVSGPTKYVSTYEMELVGNRFKQKRGIHTLVFQTIAKKLNMSFEIMPCSSFGNLSSVGASGFALENGTWTGRCPVMKCFRKRKNIFNVCISFNFWDRMCWGYCKKSIGYSSFYKSRREAISSRPFLKPDRIQFCGIYHCQGRT